MKTQVVFYIFLFSCVAIAPTAHFYSSKGRAAYILLMAALLIGIVAYSQFNAALHPIPKLWEAGFLVANLAGAIVSVGALVFIYVSAAVAAENEAEKAREESEHLLHIILPVPIAERLKTDPGTAADQFSPVSIIFADIVGFTTMAARLTPEALVKWLDEIVGAMDDLAQEFGVEKIKTIGDAWMGAAGVPEPCEDHAERIADLALAMLNETRRIAELTNRVWVWYGKSTSLI